MKNFISKGHVLSLTAPSGGVVSGTGILIGNIFGVPQASAAAGEKFGLVIEGVFELPKVSAQAWTEGAKVYWDDTAKNVTTTASGNKLIGAAVAVAANPTATGIVLLNINI